MSRLEEEGKHGLFGKQQGAQSDWRDSGRKKRGSYGCQNRLGNDGQRLECQPRSLSIIPLKEI